jgi:hypothetical protein
VLGPLSYSLSTLRILIRLGELLEAGGEVIYWREGINRKIMNCVPSLCFVR